MLNQDQGEAHSESFDIREYLAILLKRKWLILICFLLSMAGTTAFHFTRTPVYRASARLLVLSMGRAIPDDEVVGRDWLRAQKHLMRSNTMLQRVRLRMKKSPEEVSELLYGWRVGPGAIMTLSVDSPSRDFAKEFANVWADESIRFRDEQKAKMSESALLLLTREINRLSQELKAANERYVNFIRDNQRLGVTELRAQAQSQMLASYTAASSALANAQMRHELMTSKPDVASAMIVLASEDAEQALTAPVPKVTLSAESHLQDLLAAGNNKPLALNMNEPIGNNEASLGLAGGATDPSQAEQQNSLTPGLHRDYSLEIVSDDSPLYINKTAAWGLVGRRISTLFELENRRRAQQERLDQLTKRYLDKHESVLRTREQLSTTEKAIDREIFLILKTNEANLLIAQERYNRAEEGLNQVLNEAFEDRATQLELDAITDDMDRIKKMYNTFVAKLESVDVNSGFDRTQISILEEAALQGAPVYPEKKKGIMVAAAAGLGLGIALAFFIEYIDDSIKLAEEVERDLQLPFLGMVPAAQWDPDDLSSHRLDRLKQQGGITEAYRVVRSAILFTVPKEKLHSLLVTSAVPREGKTTTCVNIAIGFSQVEDRVLLIDADLRRGEVNKYFGFERDNGLADVLLGEATPENVVRRTDVANLDVITTGAFPQNPAELLLGWRLKEVIDWAKERYTRIIFDAPPMMGIADGAILGSAVDGVMLVIWAGRTSRRYVRVAKMTAVSRGAKVFGFMLNNLEPSRVGYYHYYPYYYSYYTRGYYYTREEDTAGVGGDIKDVEIPTAAGGSDDGDIDDVY